MPIYGEEGSEEEERMRICEERREILRNTVGLDDSTFPTSYPDMALLVWYYRVRYANSELTALDSALLFAGDTSSIHVLLRLRLVVGCGDTKVRGSKCDQHSKALL